MAEGLGQKYSIFSIAMFDEDNDSGHKSQLITNEIQLNKLVVKYELSSIPVVELHLDTLMPYETYMNLKNIHIIITFESIQKTYDIGIVDKVVKNNTNLIMYGFLCKYEDAMNIESSYLGDSFINSVKSLAIKKNIKINGKNGYTQDFSNDFSRDYWQIQESKIQALNRILVQAYEKSIYTMDNDTIYINTMDFSTDSKAATYPYIAPSSVEYVSKTERLATLLDSDTCIKCLNDDNTELSMNTSFGKFIIDEQDSTALVNYTSSYPLTLYQGDILMKYYYQNLLPQVQLGESMAKTSLSISTSSNLYAIEKIERFSKKDGITTCLLLSAV